MAEPDFHSARTEPMELEQTLLSLVPGLGAVLIAIASGAGGSALLELYWKPRRDGKRLAAVLYAEILQNAQFILLWTHVRHQQPRTIPADFHLSTIGFDSTSELLRELPAVQLKRVLLLYNRYQAANRQVADYAEALDEFEALKRSGEESAKVERHMDTILDTFNTGLDKAFEQSMEVVKDVIQLGRIKEKGDPEEPPPDYRARVQQHMAQRRDRLEALRGIDEP